VPCRRRQNGGFDHRNELDPHLNCKCAFEIHYPRDVKWYVSKLRCLRKLRPTQLASHQPFRYTNGNSSHHLRNRLVLLLIALLLIRFVPSSAILATFSVI
jgi:hypothetical protein